MLPLGGGNRIGRMCLLCNVQGAVMTSDDCPDNRGLKRFSRHGHDCLQGIVMPPRVAPTQVVVIPILNSKMSDADKQGMLQQAEDIVASLKRAGVRVQSDSRENYTPGWKYNHWELKVSWCWELKVSWCEASAPEVASQERCCKPWDTAPHSSSRQSDMKTALSLPAASEARQTGRPQAPIWCRPVAMVMALKTSSMLCFHLQRSTLQRCWVAHLM